VQPGVKNLRACTHLDITLMYTQLCSYAQVIRRAIGKLCVNGANAGASERASERPGPVVCQPPLTFRIPKQWPISPLILTFARFLGVRLGSRADVVDFTPGGGGISNLARVRVELRDVSFVKQGGCETGRHVLSFRFGSTMCFFFLFFGNLVSRCKFVKSQVVDYLE